MAFPPNFFSCDWGTTSLRLRLVEAASAQIRSETERTHCGVRDVAASVTAASHRAAAFQSVLAHLLAEWPEAGSMIDAVAPVVISGMASSSIGWKELPYAQVPFAVDGSQTRCEWLEVTVGKKASPVLLISGLATATEILRGEETQVIGLLAQPEFAAFARDSLVILPGTHSKHVRVQNGYVTGLQTFVTGELFDVLCHHSILRFTTTTDPGDLDEAAFLEGVHAAKTSGLMKALFQVRTRGVLGGKSTRANRAFLSGLLIGSELRDAISDPDVPRVLLAAPASLSKLYHLAGGHLGFATNWCVAGASELRQAVVLAHSIFLKRFIFAKLSVISPS